MLDTVILRYRDKYKAVRYRDDDHTAFSIVSVQVKHRNDHSPNHSRLQIEEIVPARKSKSSSSIDDMTDEDYERAKLTIHLCKGIDHIEACECIDVIGNDQLLFSTSNCKVNDSMFTIGKEVEFKAVNSRSRRTPSIDQGTMILYLKWI